VNIYTQVGLITLIGLIAKERHPQSSSSPTKLQLREGLGKREAVEARVGDPAAADPDGGNPNRGAQFGKSLGGGRDWVGPPGFFV